jgi:hypothetical protein
MGKKRGARSVMARPSRVEGRKLIRSAVLPRRLMVSRLILSPARRRMTIRAIIRKSEETVRRSRSMTSRTWGPSTMPVRSMPRRPGSLIFLRKCPESSPRRMMTARLVARALPPPVQSVSFSQ